MMSSKPDSLSLNEENALKALFMTGGDKDFITAYLAAKNARPKFEYTGTSLYRCLSRLRGYVEYRTIDGKRRFRLTRAGISKASEVPSGASFVRPGTAWSSQTELRKFLALRSKGYLLVIDPYVSEDTLDILGQVQVPIRIATLNLGRKHKEPEFLRAYQKFAREQGRSVELRQCLRSDLHGRYVFTDGSGWVIDHSLQDLGTKPALILPLDIEPVFKQVYSHFEEVFNGGTLIN